MDARQAFKFGFLARCAVEGLSHEQTVERIEKAAQGGSFLRNALFGSVEDVTDIARNLITSMKDIAHLGLEGLALGGAAGIGVPVAVGGLGGYGLARMGDIAPREIEDLRRQELISEYNRLTEQARRRQIAKNYQAPVRRVGRVF